MSLILKLEISWRNILNITDVNQRLVKERELQPKLMLFADSNSLANYVDEGPGDLGLGP